MAEKIKLIKVLKNQVLYSLPSAALLGDGFIDGVGWPADKASLVFVFPAKEAGSGEPVRDMVSGRKYVCRLTYMADKKMLPAGGTPGLSCGLTLEPFKNTAEHKKWARATDLKYFSGPFKKYLTPSFEAEAKEYYKNELPKAEGVSVRKKGRVVSMLTLLKIAGKPGSRPLDWISWVWVDPGLAKAERLAAHALLRGWLRENSRECIGASVHAANLRSQKWFLRSGFRPARISFSRRASSPAGRRAGRG
ncbi:MAG: hypothetical protein PHV36_03775 [Elusimicrobiales bacterium]|nr:hypothetical protein [Elusimicrobiales bacterium]